jgi:hypothetical protein
MRPRHWIGRGIGILMTILVVLGIASFVMMSLWNWLVPALFGGPVLDYWKALGLLVLARLLFGGFRPHHRGRWGHPWHHPRAHWEQMTPEERERFRSRLRSGWHGGGCRRGAGPDPEPEKNGSSSV